jgi:putative ABC transport system permease protein
VLLWITLKVALKSLLGNKLRSFLSMLGIIIGVAAVTSMLALGAGAQRQIMTRITAMGTNLLVVRPGAPSQHGVRGGGTFETLKIGDAQAILENIDGIEALAPVVSGRAQLKYFNQNSNTNVTGVTDTYFGVRDFQVEKGRSLTSYDDEHGERVVVLGPSTVETLFGNNSNAVGETIKIKGINFKVVGVLKSKGDQGWFNPDDMALIPLKTAMDQILGLDHLNEIDVSATNGADLKKIQEATSELLRKRHKILPEAEDDFNIRNQAELLEMATGFAETFTLLLGGIASISLIVGGIGIMNIMLVTVVERTREIGVRKAIGARDRDILRQFLLEAILVSALGGLLGVALGFGVTELLKSLSTMMTPYIETKNVVLALAVSVSVGILFGWLPARRAAALNPIEALRYE